jgi:hypothetical protein
MVSPAPPGHRPPGNVAPPPGAPPWPQPPMQPGYPPPAYRLPPSGGGTSVVVIVIVVCAALVVPMIGIMAAVAIPSFVKYTRKAKAAEAAFQLGRITQGAVAYFSADHAGASGTIGDKCFPSNDSGPIRSNADMSSGCCPQACGADDKWTAADGDGAGWKALAFSIDEPHYYKYQFTGSCCRGIDCTRAGFTARAIGDLNCDGVTGEFERTGKVAGGDVFPTPLKFDPSRELE